MDRLAPALGGSDDVTLAGNESRSPANSATSRPSLTPSGAPVLKPGTLLNSRYEILELLGEGGMGAVYKARDQELGRFVALKVIRPDLASDPAILQRFKQEVILAHQVAHKNVVRTYDLGEADGVRFITMEFLEGRSLDSLLKERGKLPPYEAVELIRQVCRGLEAAHAEGVVHRDLKPSNIMRDHHGRVAVMDFGLARSVESEARTQTGALVGTIEYMSPEQARGQHPDARSDLFALGLIFYELLTGQRPYQAESSIGSLLKRTQERAVPPAEVDATVPRPLSDIVSKCLELDAKHRYQSATEILGDLERWHSGRSLAGVRLENLKHRLRPWQVVAAILVIVVALAVLLAQRRLTLKPAASGAFHGPISVLVADFSNQTGDPIFDGTLEPLFNDAIEGAGFVNSFSRGEARKLAGKLPNATTKLDEQSARLIAIRQGLAAVIVGSLVSRENGYKVSVEALDGRTGKSLAAADVLAQNKDEVVRAIPRLAAPVRKALGDTTPESVQFDAVSGAFTAASLEAVHQDAVGKEQEFAGKFEEALKSFSKAVELDPNFARGYSAMAAVQLELGKTKEAQQSIRLAMQHEDRMTERERYRNRGLFYAMAGNWQKCVDEYTQLVERYPADRTGQLNLASCYAHVRNLPKAIEAGRRAVEIVPKGALQRLNLSFLTIAGGDFASGEQEAREALKINPSSEYGHLMLAEAQLGQGQFSRAEETYHKLQKLSAQGASLAANGLGDLALYEGRFGDAIRILEEGAKADLAAKTPDAAAYKFAKLAYVHWWRQRKQPAIAAAEKALANDQGVGTRFLAAQIFVELGEAAKAQKLAASLGAELEAEPQAYSRIIQGKLALRRGDMAAAVKALNEANGLVDTWIGRFELGRTYLQAGAFVEADSEFDRCIKRRGEALEFFMDDVPTYGYFPPVYYYQGHVRDGLKNPESANSYRTYLNIREKAGEDPLLAEIHGRLGSYK